MSAKTTPNDAASQQNKDRTSSRVYELNYPQQPLIVKNGQSFTHMQTVPNKRVAIVAIMCFGGYNQEDN
jgi:DNA-directed RNA polymerase beta subunit